MRRRPLPPIWIAAPTRFAGLAPLTARWVLLVLVALVVVATVSALTAPAPPAATHAPDARADEQADVVLYEGIVEGLRHGGAYYPLAADALRQGHYPLRPFVTFRLPTLAVVQAALPPVLVPVLLWALAAGVAAAWWRVLRAAASRPPPRLVGLALLAGGMAVFVQAELAPFHELWAGLLIAAALALRRPGEWIAAAALGLAAALVRETAAPFLVLMATFAWVEGHRREAAGWIAAIAVFALVLAAHAVAVAGVVGPLDPASPGWQGLLGPGFFVRALSLCTALALLPLAVAAPLVVLLALGWAAWSDPRGIRVAALLGGYALVLSVAARVDTFYWALLVAPASLVGLLFVPDALRDLVRAALDTRRITVRRVAR